VLAEHFSADVPSGLEQAIVTAVILNDEQWCDRLVQLLDHPDPDVHIRAGWALQQLAESPGTLAAMLKHAQLWTERLVEPNPELPVRPVDIIRMAFVFQAFGHNQYQPAEELLRIYVPKQSQKMKPVTRTAAIWSLGRILEGSKNRKLADRLAQRMLDNNPFEPEDRTVKYVSAIAIGYIGEENLIGRLQQGMQISSIEEDADQATKLDYACDWAIKRLQNPVPNNQ
jgi:HEAT repeat protein